MRIAVIGLGHIGLPLAVQYASRGHSVVGGDTDPAIVDAINAGRSPHDDEPALLERVPQLVASGLLRATTDDAAAAAHGEVVVVIVPVVVDAAREVDFGPIDAATAETARGLRPGSLVIYETTLPVGTTRDRLTPMLAAGSGLALDRDLWVAYSPERVLVGRVLIDLRRYPKVVGGTSPEATARAVQFYRDALEPGTEVRSVASAESAEMVKLAETTYRDVNIALANEFARYAAGRRIDVSEVIEAANSQPYSHIHAPGVGVGGHCIPVYPHFLFNGAPEVRLPRLAREVNDSMAAWAVDQLRLRLGGTLSGAAVLVAGIAYRADVREDAFSAAFGLRDALRAAGAEVLGHDPYFDDEHLRSVGFEPFDAQAVRPIRAVVVQAAHAAYRDFDWGALPGLELVLDGRNALDRATIEAAGIAYAGIGR